MIRLSHFPSFREHHVDVPVRPGFLSTNISVTAFEGRIFGVMNAIDHYLGEEGYFIPIDPDHNPRKAARNLMYLVSFAPDLSVEWAHELELQEPVETPWEFRGFESPRLFGWRGALHIAACSSGTGDAPGAKFYMARLKGHHIVGVRNLAPHNAFFAEKNWMPEVLSTSDLRFHYKLGTLADRTGWLWSPCEGNDDLDHLHGGTQVIAHEGGRLCMVHSYLPVEGTYRKATRQHFVRIAPDGTPGAVSEPVEFAAQLVELEVATGMAYHPNLSNLIVSYGRVGDDPEHPYQERPFIAELALSDLRRVI